MHKSGLHIYQAGKQLKNRISNKRQQRDQLCQVQHLNISQAPTLTIRPDQPTIKQRSSFLYSHASAIHGKQTDYFIEHGGMND